MTDEYDLLFLGWAPAFRPLATGFTTVAAPPAENASSACVYRLHHWMLMHAYIISPPAMVQMLRLQFNSSGTGAPRPKPIDTELELLYDHGRFYTVYPMFAFQVKRVSEPAMVGRRGGRAWGGRGGGR